MSIIGGTFRGFSGIAMSIINVEKKSLLGILYCYQPVTGRVGWEKRFSSSTRYRRGDFSSGCFCFIGKVFRRLFPRVPSCECLGLCEGLLTALRQFLVGTILLESNW